MSAFNSKGKRFSKRISLKNTLKKINPNYENLQQCCEEGIYKIKEYNYLCSQCLKKSNPEIYHIKISEKNNGVKNPCYSNNELEQETRRLALPLDHHLYKALIWMCKTGAIENGKEILNILSYMQLNTIYRGWGAEQAEELTSIYRFHHCNNTWKGFGAGGEKWRIQHAICGGVIDRWNLHPDKHGGVGFCYYNIPKPTKFIREHGLSFPTKIPSTPPCFQSPTFVEEVDSTSAFRFWRKSIPN